MKRVPLLAAAVVLFAGCASIAPPAELKAPPGDPVPCKVAVAPLLYEVPALAEGESAGVIPMLQSDLYNEIYNTLNNFSAFSKLYEIETAESKSFLTPKEYKLDAYIKQAAGKGADMLVTFSVKNYKTYYRGTNGSHFSSIALWVALWWPSWFIADETYGSVIDVEMKVYSTKREKLEPVFTRLIRAKKEFDLDDFQRGWQFWGIIRVPGSLDESSWKQISDIITPHAVRELKSRLITCTRGQEFRKEVMKHVEKIKGEAMALVIGVNDYENKDVPDLAFAEQDAREIENLVRSGGDFKQANIISLSGSKATAKAARAALAKIFDNQLASRPRVFIYLACHGLAVNGKTAFALADYNPADTKTALTLDELAAHFDRLPADNLVFITDAGFSKNENARGLSSSEDAEKISTSELVRIASAPGRAVLFAASPGQPSAVISKKKHGLFTYFLLSGAQGRADENSDGKITLKEIYDYLSARRFERQAKVLHVKQKPFIKGDATAFKVNK